ncbi:MAG: Ni/Fe-hydrogenase cytochrome b subunit [Limnochorda sp.]|uniref:NrfD/PsrC family molybdoenzyme membrane anchor subunit n=1 Tax=Limnochorda TaxID=1676651 RepID=UPI001D2F593B|nr:Ni/Fe-hydrogenase cytochrome b subunit [Limnochorda pilosa]MBO2486609.1 Ni/Fe-hydrogenase cytochrome b subunit [Bacillota bacterium]MBO2518502.1 Ni/Fe-hydrogenase cytochrome b subunit [Bacillota bacterium]
MKELTLAYAPGRVRDWAWHLTWTWPRVVLALVAGAGFVATIYRFIFGLGAATNLSDEWPWALWISLNVLSGVALSAGAFTIAAAVYLFRQRALKPLLRPAILLGFLGYLQVIMGLIVELGKPWNIWHPIIMWQPRSAMFEVAWCVMLYTVVLFLEFAPVLLEKVGAKARWLRAAQRITPALVVAGVVLSTLHQSSLGTFFVLVPGKLHPLWNTILLPLLFFTSAIVMAIGVVSLMTALAYGTLVRWDPAPLTARLLRWLPWAVGLYLILKVGDLVARGQVGELFTGSPEAGLFWLELALIVLPAVLALQPRLRSSRRGQGWLGALVVAGVILNRFNVSHFGLRAWTAAGYVPSLPELAISLGLMAATVLAFIAIAENLPVFSHRPPADRGA